MKSEPLIFERVIQAPPARVWKAITDKNDMKQWYFDLAEFRAEVGFEFTFTGNNEGKAYVHLCKVTIVEPPKKLQYTWRYEGEPGNSFVTFELFPDGNSTRLKLTHEGLETFPQTKAYQRSNFEAGWTELIGKLLPDFVENKQQV